MAGGRTDGRGTFRAFRYPNYRIYAAGTMVSGLGTWMQRVAQDWLVLQLSGRASDLGMVVALQFLSIMLFAPVAGVLVDRYSKRALIVVANILMGLSASGLALLDATGQARVWHVFVLGFVLGGLSALETPARQAFAGEMVRREDITNALSLGGSLIHCTRLIGPALAGVLIAFSGTSLVFWLNGLSYLAVVASMALMKRAQLTPSERPTRAAGGLGTALRYLRHRADLNILLVIIGAAGLFTLNLQLSITLMATSQYGLHADGFGLLTSTLAIGSVLGGLTGARIADPTPRLVVRAGIAFGLTVIVYSMMPNAITFGLALIPTGGLCMLLMTTCSACFQLAAPPTARGRLMALYYAVMMGCTGLGALLIGHAASLIGLRATLAAGGVGTAAVCVIGWLVLSRAASAVPVPAPVPAASTV